MLEKNKESERFDKGLDSIRQNSIKKQLTGRAWHRLNLSVSQAVGPYRMNSFWLRFLKSLAFTTHFNMYNNSPQMNPEQTADLQDQVIRYSD